MARWYELLANYRVASAGMRPALALGLLVPLFVACSAPQSTMSPASGQNGPAATTPAAGPFRVSQPRCTGTSYSATLTNASKTLTASVAVDVEFTRGSGVLSMGEAPVTAPVGPGQHVTATSTSPSGRPGDRCKLLDYVVAMPDGSYPTYPPSGR